MGKYLSKLLSLSLFVVLFCLSSVIGINIVSNVANAFSIGSTKATIEYVVDSTEVDQGLIGNGKTIKAYVDAIGAVKKATIKINHSSAGNTTTYTFSTSETVTSNITLDIEPGAIIDIAVEKTLTINGPFDAGLYQVFNGDGSVYFGKGNVSGIRPEWWGGIGDDSTDCTAAFAKTVTAAEYGVATYNDPKQNILLSAGTYQVTATTGNYAVTVHCPIKGEGSKVSNIKNMGEGSALKIEGLGDGEIYYSHFSGFSVVGNASSEDGISVNPSMDLNKAVGYCKFEDVYSHDHGRHGLVHDTSWGTHYANCQFYRNGGLGVYLPGTNAYSQHNNIIFRDCNSRWNGGTGNASADYLKGGVRISGVSSGVYWEGGIVESNNAWGFIIGEDATYTAFKVVIRGVYGESHMPTVSDSTIGGFLRLSAKYEDVSVADSTIYYGAPAGKTGYAFYVANIPEGPPGLREWDNTVQEDGRPGTATRSFGVTNATDFNIIHFTRALTDASGNVSYTDIGFKPRLIIFHAGSGTDLKYWSVGSAMSSTNMGVTGCVSTTGETYSTSVACILASEAWTAHKQVATLVSMNDDGFTLDWTKTGTPTGTVRITAICYR